MNTTLRNLLLAVTLIVLALPRGVRADALMIPHPDDASKHVEYFVGQPQGKGPWPTIVLLHGHADSGPTGGVVFVKWGVLDEWAKRGVLAVAVSMPGYGASSGPRDFCGALTQHAVDAVIGKLRADGAIAPGKLAIEGISRGAITAALVAAHDPKIDGLVAISGEFDLAALAADAKVTGVKAAIRQSLMDESGGTSDELKARSVINFAQDIKAQVLLLNGAKDDRTNPDNARKLAEAITRAGGKARAIIYPDFGHQIPVDVRAKDIEPFLAQVWGTKK